MINFLKQGFIFFLIGAVLQAQNTAIFPTNLSTNLDLTIAKDRAQSTLNTSISNSDVSIVLVANASLFPTTGSFILTIDAEQILACSRSGSTVTVCDGGRGYNGTSAASHTVGAAIRLNIVSWQHNQLAAEVKALEQQTADIRSFNFSRTNGSGYFSGNLAAAGSKTVTFSALCPWGVTGADTNHPLYVSGGTGTAEVVTITGGTCTSGAVAGGNITFTTVNTHTGAWILSSATSGLKEAAINGNYNINVPAGTYTIYSDFITDDTPMNVDCGNKAFSYGGKFIPGANDLNLFYANTSRALNVSNCSFDANSKTGITYIRLGNFTNTNNKSYIFNNNFLDGEYAVVADAVSLARIENNDFSFQTVNPVKIANQINNDMSAGFVLNNTFFTQSSGVIAIDHRGVGATKIIGNSFNGFITQIQVEPYLGTVNTSGTAVTWVSGYKFQPAWTYLYIQGTLYSIATVVDDTHITLTGSAGSRTGHKYTTAVSGQLLIQDNIFDNCEIHASLACSSIGITGTNPFYGVSIENNQFINFTNIRRADIVLNNTLLKGTSIIGNKIHHEATSIVSVSLISLILGNTVTISNNDIKAAEVSYGILTVDAVTSVTISENTLNVASASTLLSLGTGTRLVDFTSGLVYGNLGASIKNGSSGYISDGAVTSGADNTCTSGGTGAMFMKLNGVLRCFNAQN